MVKITCNICNKINDSDNMLGLRVNVFDDPVMSIKFAEIKETDTHICKYCLKELGKLSESIHPLDCITKGE